MTKFTCTVGRDGRKYYFKDGKRCKKSEVPQGTKCKGDKKESPVKKIKPKKETPAKKTKKESPPKKASPPKRKVFSSKALAARKPPPKPQKKHTPPNKPLPKPPTRKAKDTPDKPPRFHGAVMIPQRSGKTPPKPPIPGRLSVGNFPIDVLRLMAMELSVEDLFSYCTTNKRFKKLCSEPRFWEDYVKKHRGEFPRKVEGMSWQWMARHTWKMNLVFKADFDEGDTTGARSLNERLNDHESTLRIIVQSCFKQLKIEGFKKDDDIDIDVKMNYGIVGRFLRIGISIGIFSDFDRMKDKEQWKKIATTIFHTVRYIMEENDFFEKEEDKERQIKFYGILFDRDDRENLEGIFGGRLNHDLLPRMRSILNFQVWFIPHLIRIPDIRKTDEFQGGIAIGVEYDKNVMDAKKKFDSDQSNVMRALIQKATYVPGSYVILRDET